MKLFENADKALQPSATSGNRNLRRKQNPNKPVENI